MDSSNTPYVTPWSGESAAPAPLTITAAGVAYTDPIRDAMARDLDSVLWTECFGTTTGTPEYAAELHPERQRETMEGLLCAGCKEPAARNEDGMLWLLPLLDDSPDVSWEGVQTAIPPMCEACAKAAARLCPRLRDGHVVLRVREAEAVGVKGTLYPRPGEQHEPDPDAVVRYDSRDLSFVVARQAVRELRRVTVVAFVMSH